MGEQLFTDASTSSQSAPDVTDTYYYTDAPTIYDTQARHAGRPATYGVTFSALYRNSEKDGGHRAART